PGAVADVDAVEGCERIEVALSVGIPDVATLAAHHDDAAVGRTGEVTPEVIGRGRRHQGLLPLRAERACFALTASQSSIRCSGSSGWRPVCSFRRSIR